MQICTNTSGMEKVLNDSIVYIIHGMLYKYVRYTTALRNHRVH